MTTTTITRNTTLAYDRGSSDVALLAETIGANFDRTVATHGHREALVEYDSARRWTYAQLRADVDALAHVVLIGSAQWQALPDRDGDPRVLATAQAAADPHDAINIQYTSGTTGHPKGATPSHHNILNNAHIIGEVCRYTEADRICVPV